MIEYAEWWHMVNTLNDQWVVLTIIWCKLYVDHFLNDLVGDDSERDLWLRLFQSLALLALNERFWNRSDLKVDEGRGEIKKTMGDAES